jgi:hypothetical protein
LHPTDRLTTYLERAPLVSSTEFTYRVIAERWRDSPLSAIGAFERGGRYNAPRTFSVLYSADSPVTALQETEALFATSDGQLHGVPRDPEIILTLECTLLRVLDLTKSNHYRDLGTTREELISFIRLGSFSTPATKKPRRSDSGWLAFVVDTFRLLRSLARNMPKGTV